MEELEKTEKVEKESTEEIKTEELTFEEKVELVYQYGEIVKANEAIKENCDKVIKENQKKIDELKADILASMQKDEMKETVIEREGGNLYANVGVNSTTGYADEEAVINYLKEHNHSDFLKVTTAIKKKELNAELKNNAALKKDIDSFITTKHTPYVVVTNEENHTKMLEHINEGVAKKLKKGN